jgi:hypothetical protein
MVEIGELVNERVEVLSSLEHGSSRMGDGVIGTGTSSRAGS